MNQERQVNVAYFIAENMFADFYMQDAILNPASNQSTELHRSVLYWMENKKKQ